LFHNRSILSRKRDHKPLSKREFSIPSFQTRLKISYAGCSDGIVPLNLKEECGTLNSAFRKKYGSIQNCWNFEQKSRPLWPAFAVCENTASYKD